MGRRSSAPLLGAALLITLGETASAQEQAGTPADTESAPEAASAREETVSAEGQANTAAPSGASPSGAAAEASPLEPAAPAKVGDESVPADASCEPPVSEELLASSSFSAEQSRALWPLTWKKSPGQGFSFGMEEGLWGNSWSQGLRVTIPFTRHLGATLRGVYLIDMASGPFTADAGGRIDFFGRSPVLLNVVRLYGGGGVQVLAPAANTGGRTAQVGVGGHFGFEFFHNPHFSYFLEVGGQGGEPSPGATVVAGLMFYPWTR